MMEILTEMAFDKKVAEGKIRSREEMINVHLAKILAFDAAASTFVCWRKEILGETAFISNISIRVGKQVRRFTAGDLMRLLYAEPFEDNEVAYCRALIAIAIRDMERETRRRGRQAVLPRNSRSEAEIAAIVRDTYLQLCPLLASGDAGSMVVEQVR